MKNKKLKSESNIPEKNEIEIDVTERPKKKKVFDFKHYLLVGLVIALVISGFAFFFKRSFVVSGIVFVVTLLLFAGYIFLTIRMKRVGNIRKMEQVFPDFIELMASNLRAGMTVDKALLLSSRKEFAPLDAEIFSLGKDIVTGIDMSVALKKLADRIDSEKIRRTITLIITGLNSGGNLSVILEETAVNMREKNFVEKKAASNVLMYVIFVFFAVAVGAPALFGLSSVLVEVLSKILADIPAQSTAMDFPFTLTKINVSTTFIFYFSLVFLLVIDVLASFVLGLVMKGNEKEGVKFMVPMVVLSLSIYLASRFILLQYFADFFS